MNEVVEMVYSGLFPNGSVTSVTDNLDGTVDLVVNSSICGEIPACCMTAFTTELYYTENNPITNPQCPDEFVDIPAWANPVLVSFQCIDVTDDCCPDYEIPAGD